MSPRVLELLSPFVLHLFDDESLEQPFANEIEIDESNKLQQFSQRNVAC